MPKSTRMEKSSRPAALTAILVALACRMASGEIEVEREARCETGTRVYSITTRDGQWLDAMTITCTNNGGAPQIPDPDDVPEGGPDVKNWTNCGNTAGLLSMEWTRPDYSFCMGGSEDAPVINLNLTCIGGETYGFADDHPTWGPTDVTLNSCDEGYVQGISSVVRIFEEEDDCPGRSYLITKIGFVCSQEPLQAICDASYCSYGKQQKSPPPEFCPTPYCSEEDCCEEAPSSSPVTEIVISVISSVIGAILLACLGLWYRKKIAGSCWCFPDPDRSQRERVLDHPSSTPTPAPVN